MWIQIILLSLLASSLIVSGRVVPRHPAPIGSSRGNSGTRGPGFCDPSVGLAILLVSIQISSYSYLLCLLNHISLVISSEGVIVAQAMIPETNSHG
ncbi:hypothetical protein DFH28DRAFT_992529, partial [Melampsora americana]